MQKLVVCQLKLFASSAYMCTRIGAANMQSKPELKHRQHQLARLRGITTVVAIRRHWHYSYSYSYSSWSGLKSIISPALEHRAAVLTVVSPSCSLPASSRLHVAVVAAEPVQQVAEGRWSWLQVHQQQLAPLPRSAAVCAACP